MRFPQSRTLIWLACVFFAIEIIVALVFPAGQMRSTVGDLFPLIFMVLALVGFRQNWLRSGGLLRTFWLLNAAGFGIMILSQLYAIYYDFHSGQQPENSIPGDALFLLSLIPVLGALALHPHVHSSSQRLRFRRLDFILLTAWWFCLFVYFAVPWQYVVRDMVIYNRVVYLLLFVEHSAVAAICAFSARQSTAAWKNFYRHFFVAFLLFAGGNLLTSIALERQVYYAGGLFDIPWSASLVWIVVAIHAGRNLEAAPQSTAEIDTGSHGLWTARFAMLALISFPALSILGYLYGPARAVIGNFRLRVAFAAMLPMGALAFFKIRLLDRELLQMVHLTATSVQNLESVQVKLTESEKMAALGRLASGAGHEISNPLTAILGYAELLEDNPTLSAQERQYVDRVQQQVHRAQAAVLSMRTFERDPAPSSLTKSGRQSSE